MASHGDFGRDAFLVDGRQPLPNRVMSELPVIRPQLRPALILFTSSCRQEAGLSLIPHHHGGSSF
jgi:hypothetical protein